MLVPLLAGIGLGMGAAASVRGRHPSTHGPAPVGVTPQCTASLILFAVDTRSGAMIDRISGGAGYSHVAIDGCEVAADGTPLLIDCTPREGVHRRPLGAYGDRPVALVVLQGEDAAELYGCARAKVGTPFNLLGANCAGFAYQCLPRTLQDRIDAARGGRSPAGIITPNQLAAAFGAKLGHATLVA